MQDSVTRHKTAGRACAVGRLKHTLLASLTLVALAGAPLGADLRYTMRVEVRDSATPAPVPAGAVGEFLKRLQQGILQAIAPGGSLQVILAANDEGVRVEYSEATPSVPKGHALLTKADGTSMLVDPIERTYRKLSRLQTGDKKRPSLVTDVKSTRTNEVSTIAGVRAERVTFTTRLDLPEAVLRQLPPEAPRSFTLEGEMWITDQVKAPVTVTEMTNPALQALGLDRVVENGFVMRQIIRGSLLGAREVETAVSAIDGGTIAPELLRLPEGYRELSGAGKQ